MVAGSWVSKRLYLKGNGLYQEQRNLGVFNAQSELEEASWWDLMQLSTIFIATSKEVPPVVWMIHTSEVEIGDPPEVTGMSAPTSQLPGQDRDSWWSWSSIYG